MSATGQGGVSVIQGTDHANISTVTILGDGGTLTFTHNVHRKAYQVIITDSAGNVVNASDGVTVTQPDADTIVITKSTEGNLSCFVECRWEHNTPEMDLIQPGDARVVLSELII